MSVKTKNILHVEKWAKKRGGKPAIVKDTKDLLRIKFDELEDDLEQISWAKFFEIFKKKKLMFLFDESENSRFHKFIEDLS